MHIGDMRSTGGRHWVHKPSSCSMYGSPSACATKCKVPGVASHTHTRRSLRGMGHLSGRTQRCTRCTRPPPTAPGAACPQTPAEWLCACLQSAWQQAPTHMHFAWPTHARHGGQRRERPRLQTALFHATHSGCFRQGMLLRDMQHRPCASGARLLLGGARREHGVEGVLALLVLPDVVQRQLVRDVERHLRSPDLSTSIAGGRCCLALLITLSLQVGYWCWGSSY